RVGYSSFSAIDTTQALAQTKRCLEDYLCGRSKLLSVVSDGHEDAPRGADLGGRKPERQPSKGQAGTCSLLFDLEQLGGARFGLPRILKLLDRFGARATSFTTNFIT